MQLRERKMQRDSTLGRVCDRDTMMALDFYYFLFLSYGRIIRNIS